jgi:hypothetical protein
MRSDWQAIPWRIGGEMRTDYRRSVYGPAGCELRLAAEEWPSRAGWWAARAEIVRDSTARAYLPLWGRGHKMAGYPTPEAAMEAAEAWLAKWVAGWAAANDAALLAEIPEGGPLVVREGGGDAP